MPAVLRAADLLVHASEIELEGMAVLEALGTRPPGAGGRRAPAAPPPGWPLGDEFRFPAGDAEELARSIDHLVEHPERLAAARAASLAVARGLTGSRPRSRKLEAIYQRVARPVPATGAAARAARSRASPAAR